MPAPLPDVIARILTLNSDELPFVYEPRPYGVVARWKWADARWHNILAAGSYQQDYELHIELDPATSTWKSTEMSSGSEANIGVSGASFSSTRFRGTVYRKSFRKDVAVNAESTDRHGTTSGHVWEARFSSEDVKRPAIDTLTALGWTRKKGFWASLFS